MFHFFVFAFQCAIALLLLLAAARLASRIRVLEQDSQELHSWLAKEARQVDKLLAAAGIADATAAPPPYAGGGRGIGLTGGAVGTFDLVPGGPVTWSRVSALEAKVETLVAAAAHKVGL